MSRPRSETLPRSRSLFARGGSPTRRFLASFFSWGGCPTRLSRSTTIVTCASLLLAAHALALQPSPPDKEPSSLQLERFLAENDLPSVLAAHLRERLAHGTPEERSRAAESLGDLYVKQLRTAPTPELRQQLEAQARDLLRAVPESRSYALRLELAKATYLQAEELAERDRLRMGTPADRAEAERILRSIAPVFSDIAARVGRRLDELERQERSARDEDVAEIRQLASDARSLRSLARYYSGWTSYYLALVTASPQAAADAAVEFGSLLGAPPAKPATIEQASKAFLRLEHVARAAMGVALAASLRANHTDAIRWLDLIETTEDLPAALHADLFFRRIIVYAAAGRWSQLDAMVRLHKRTDDGKPSPLSLRDARLIAVLTLDALQRRAVPESEKPLAERLSQNAMADLVARGEVGHVLNLMNQFGSVPLGDEGFVAQLVRGLYQYDLARQAHRAQDPKPDLPTKDPALINQYRASAKMLQQAVSSPDASERPNELANARLRLGFARFYAGDLEDAAATFQAAFESFPLGEPKRDALWFAITSLDLAIEAGKPSLTPARDRLAMLMVQSFPGSEYAARLLLRQTNADAVDPEQGVKILLAVKKDSPAYNATRRQASQLLYRLYTRAAPDDRAFAAVRFAEIAEEAMELAKAEALASSDKLAQESAAWVVRAARQIADAMLSLPAPETRRAQAALEALEAVTAHHRIGLDDATQSELLFRRFQIAVAKNDAPARDRTLAELRQRPGPFAAAADKMLYRKALVTWRAVPSDLTSARQLVTHGLVLISRASDTDSSLPPMRLAVAEAAAALWTADKDEFMRDRAIELDRTSAQSGGRTEAVLRRLAQLTESKGDLHAALDAWKDLSAALVPSSPAWYEARYNSIRLQWDVNAPAAIEAMRQHILLHPSYAPEPWGSKLRELDEKMGASRAAPTPAPPKKPGGGG